MPGGTVGSGRGNGGGLRLAGPVGGPDPHQVIAGRDRDSCLPLDPGLVGERFGQLSLGPWLVVELNLDPLKSLQWCPGHSGYNHFALLERGTVVGHIDAGVGLDRALLGPAPRYPVGVEALP